MINKICKICHSTYRVGNYRDKTSFYCSVKCYLLDPEWREKISNMHKGKSSSPNTTFKKGHIQSEEARKKMSLAKIGKLPPNKKPDVFIICLFCKIKKKIKPTLEGRQKYCSKSCADNGKNYGKTTLQERLRRSKKYKIWRKAIFERDNYTCQICFMRGGYIHADHIKSFAHFPEERFNIDNGRTLCIECHRKTPNYGNKARQRQSPPKLQPPYPTGIQP